MSNAQDDRRKGEVLEFWFGPAYRDGEVSEGYSPRWFKKDPAFDDEIRQRFESLYDDIVAERCEAWLETADGTLAYVIVLDQFSRNMYRDTAKMYAADDLALAVATRAIDSGQAKQLSPAHRVFLYMPLMHAEDLEAQRRCCALFDELAREPGGERFRGNYEFAVKHLEVVERFGRFPHRNQVLARPATPEEDAYLAAGGARF